MPFRRSRAYTLQRRYSHARALSRQKAHGIPSSTILSPTTAVLTPFGPIPSLTFPRTRRHLRFTTSLLILNARRSMDKRGWITSIFFNGLPFLLKAEP